MALVRRALVQQAIGHRAFGLGGPMGKARVSFEPCQHLRTYRIPQALPAQLPPLHHPLHQRVRLRAFLPFGLRDERRFHGRQAETQSCRLADST